MYYASSNRRPAVIIVRVIVAAVCVMVAQFRLMLFTNLLAVPTTPQTTITAAVAAAVPNNHTKQQLPLAAIHHLRLNNHNNRTTTLRDLVMASGGCDGDYRNYPVSVQDSVNELLGAAMMRDMMTTAAVAADDEAPTPLSDVAQLCQGPAFTGAAVATAVQPPNNKTLLFSAYMFSHEMEMLEARLYEGMGIVDRHFVAESGYTHRGHRKRKFATELLASSPRFRRFQDVVQIVDLDLCPAYLETVLKYRRMHPRPQDIWDTQDAAQHCLAAAVREYAAQLEHNAAETALVQVSDLDEIPFRTALASVKECELKPQQQQFPMPFSTTHIWAGKVCRPAVNYRIGGMLFRAANMTGQRRPAQALNGPGLAKQGIQGGVHLTYFGGSLVEFFKTSNHAEGGQMNTLGWLNVSYNPTVCECTVDDWYRREELLCTDKDPVIQPWKSESPARREQPPVAVGDEHLPWVIARNRERYPCFFAEHKKCVNGYIDIML